jgi:hypothetical protein
MAIGTAHLGIFGTAESNAASRELNAIGRAREWLNSPRLTPEALAGKVVLVQFCTYTCINWLRTLPYVRAWAQKYGRQAVSESMGARWRLDDGKAGNSPEQPHRPNRMSLSRP